MLSGKEKRLFRSQANQIKASVMIGREGLSTNVGHFIDEAFNSKNLVKVRVLDTCNDDRRQVAAQLDKIKDTEVVQLLGRTILLYRPLKENESE
jgi:RNA-binding protein